MSASFYAAMTYICASHRMRRLLFEYAKSAVTSILNQIKSKFRARTHAANF